MRRDYRQWERKDKSLKKIGITEKPMNLGFGYLVQTLHELLQTILYTSHLTCVLHSRHSMWMKPKHKPIYFAFLIKSHSVYVY
jgi:hypothetical protein